MLCNNGAQRETITRPLAMYQAGALMGIEMKQRHGATFSFINLRLGIKYYY